MLVRFAFLNQMHPNPGAWQHRVRYESTNHLQANSEERKRKVFQTVSSNPRKHPKLEPEIRLFTAGPE